MYCLYMNERFEGIEAEPTIREKIVALGIELSESGEFFPFPGMDRNEYTEIKKGEDPFYHTPIDQLIHRFQTEGLKVVLTKYGSDVLILPSSSDDIVNDSLFPRSFGITEEMDERLKALILLQQEFKAEQQV
jgi:hypothetical protein